MPVLLHCHRTHPGPGLYSPLQHGFFLNNLLQTYLVGSGWGDVKRVQAKGMAATL